MRPSDPPSGPGYRATVAALALGQVLSWAVLYYAFSSLVLPMDQALGWGQPALMGAPSWLRLYHVITKSPSASMATFGRY